MHSLVSPNWILCHFPTIMHYISSYFEQQAGFELSQSVRCDGASIEDTISCWLSRCNEHRNSVCLCKVAIVISSCVSLTIFFISFLCPRNLCFQLQKKPPLLFLTDEVLRHTLLPARSQRFDIFSNHDLHCSCILPLISYHRQTRRDILAISPFSLLSCHLSFPPFPPLVISGAAHQYLALQGSTTF